jgi:GGDEF domain-containing protein
MSIKRDRDILYEQEVVSFLLGFLYGGGNAAPHTPPASLDEILEDVHEIWDDVQQFVKPVQLRKELLKEYLNAEREDQIINLTGLLGRMRFEDRDPMTGYMRKTELGIITGLAHLYSKISNEPSAIIELDFSNMGGTNDFFAQLIAEAEGIAIDEVDMRRAEGLTDKAAGLVAEIVINELQKSSGEDSVILPVRAGGDELRIIATDIELSEFKKIQHRIHHQIEMSMARLGLMGHEHKKHPIEDLRFIEPETYSEKADRQIEIEKKVLGFYRTGESPPIDIAQQSDFCSSVFNNATSDDGGLRVLQENAELRARSYAAASKMAGTSEDFIAEQRLQNIEAELASNSLDTDYKQDHTYMPAALSTETPPFILDKSEYNPALLYMSVAEDYEWRLVHLLNEEGLDVDAYEMEMLHAALMGLTPHDPAAGVLTPRDMPRQLEIYLRDAEVHVEHLAPVLTQENTSKAASKMGPLNNALRLAHKMPEELEDIKPIMLGVAFHNLAGLNKVFGHDNADKALRFMAQNVLKDTLAEAGFDDDDYAIAHEGGGAFTIIFKPIIEEKKGFFNIKGANLIPQIAQEFERRIEDLNELSPQDFMAVLNMTLEDEESLDAFDMETMADLPDQKHRPWINGLHVSTEYVDLSGRDFVLGQTRTGQMLYELKDALEQKVERDRAVYRALFEYNHPDQKQRRPSSAAPK